MMGPSGTASSSSLFKGLEDARWQAPRFTEVAGSDYGVCGPGFSIPKIRGAFSDTDRAKVPACRERTRRDRLSPAEAPDVS